MLRRFASFAGPDGQMATAANVSGVRVSLGLATRLCGA